MGKTRRKGNALKEMCPAQLCCVSMIPRLFRARIDRADAPSSGWRGLIYQTLIRGRSRRNICRTPTKLEANDSKPECTGDAQRACAQTAIPAHSDRIVRNHDQ